MPLSRRALILALIVATLLLAAGRWWPSDPDGGAQPAAAQAPGEIGASILEADPESAAPTATSRPVAERDPPSEAVRVARPEESESFTALFDLDEQAVAAAAEAFNDLLTAVRAGDPGSAQTLSRRFEQCRGLFDDKGFQLLVQAGNVDTWMVTVPEHVDHPWRSTFLERKSVRLEEYRQQLPECLGVFANADEVLRKELERLAERGNVAARYLYATWPPQRDIASPSWEQVRHWELRALEFSLASLEAGETLGFYVFARAYNGDLFTGRDQTTSFAFLTAGLRCGLQWNDEPYGNMDSALLYYSKARHYEPPPQPLIDLLLARSDELRPYCRSDTWWSAEQFTQYFLALFES